MEVLSPALEVPTPGTLTRGGENVVSSATVTKIVTLTQAAYDAIGNKDNATLYVIVG